MKKNQIAQPKSNRGRNQTCDPVKVRENSGFNKKGYKKTKLGWIPEEWEVMRLGEVCSVKGDYGINAAAVEYSTDLPTYLRITDISPEGNFIDSEKKSVDHPQSNNFLLEDDDIVFARTGASVGKTYFHKKENGELVFAGFLIRFRTIKEILSSKYLSFYVQTNKYWNWVKVNSMRSGQPGINSREYCDLPIPVPTYPEQRKIATILSTWDRAIAKQQQLIAAKQEYKKGLMQLLLTGKLRFAGFEGEWERVKLSDVSIFRNGKGHEKSISMDGDFVVVNSKFISTDGEVRKYTNDQFSPLNKDDIVMVMSDVPNGRALAKCYIIEEDGKYSLNQRICSLKPKKMNVNFLKNQLNRNKYYLKFNDGISQTNLKKKEVLNCPILKPELKEQQKIATVLSAADKEIALLENELEQMREQKRGLMQRLLTGEVRVKNRLK